MTNKKGLIVNDGLSETGFERRSSSEYPKKFELEDKEIAEVRFVGSTVIAKIHWKAHPSRTRIVCPQTFDRDAACPVCEHVKGTKDEAHFRNYTYLIDYRDKTLRAWSYTMKSRESLVMLAKMQNVTKLSERAVRIGRVGNGLETKYTFVISGKKTELTRQDIALIEKYPAIETSFEQPDLQELNNLFTYRQSASPRLSVPGSFKKDESDFLGNVNFSLPTADLTPKEDEHLF